MQQNQTLKRLNDEWVARRLVQASGNPVLLADDSEADIYFLLRAFDASGVTNPVYVTRTGAETLEFLRGSSPFTRNEFPKPEIIFLDLMMPGIDGFQILRWKGTQPDYERSLFVALSNSNRTQHISQAYDLGANTFLSKPLEGQQISNLIEAYKGYWQLVASRNQG